MMASSHFLGLPAKAAERPYGLLPSKTLSLVMKMPSIGSSGLQCTTNLQEIRTVDLSMVLDVTSVTSFKFKLVSH